MDEHDALPLLGDFLAAHPHYRLPPGTLDGRPVEVADDRTLIEVLEWAQGCGLVSAKRAKPALMALRGRA